MKNKYMFLCLMVGAWQSAHAEALAFAVPKHCLAGKSSLALDMLDSSGKKCVGLCQLDEKFENRTIMRRDLEIKSENIFDHFSQIIDVTHASQPCDHEVLLRVEFDVDLQVLRALIVQDSISNGFTEITSDVEEDVFDSFDDDFDDFASLLSEVDIEAVSKQASSQSLSRFEEYSLYLQVYMSMQYGHAKRTFNNVMSWFYESN